jgi:hypothetical protein
MFTYYSERTDGELIAPKSPNISFSTGLSTFIGFENPKGLSWTTSEFG